MTKLPFFLIAWLFTAFSSMLFASGGGPVDCIGAVCLKANSHGYKWMLSNYGSGTVSKDEGLEVHCFYAGNQRLWVEFEYEKATSDKKGAPQLTGVFISTKKLCGESYAPKKPFPPFVLRSTVGIGASEADVTSILGQPKRVDDVLAIEKKSPYLLNDHRYSSRYGTHRLVYDTGSELLFNFFSFENGKLTSIWLADRE